MQETELLLSVAVPLGGKVLFATFSAADGEDSQTGEMGGVIRYRTSLR